MFTEILFFQISIILGLSSRTLCRTFLDSRQYSRSTNSDDEICVP